ncbi:Anti-sigma-K factor rskA [compost metagenome]
MEEGKAYIESGILELYVLGQLTVEEQHEVEAMAARYPEVKQEIEAIEIAMEQYAMNHAVAPSENLKDKLFDQLNSAAPEQENITTATAPPVQASVVPLQNNSYESKIRTLRIALVACAVLLLISIIALFSAHNDLGNAKNEIMALNRDKEKFATTVSDLKESNTDLQKIADMPEDPDWKIVKLAGTAMDPKAKMVVYWHTSGRHVMVDNSKMGLPANDEAHQYQLWAMVNGKPVDLGVFDVKADSTHILLQMKEIASAQAFAVTLEKRGGSPAPTMNKMVVMGGVSI